MIGTVRFSHRRVIDFGSQSVWDKALFDATWFEYKLQVQNFVDFARYKDFADFLNNEPNAETIHSRVSPAVYPSLQQLEGKIPVLTDANSEAIELNQFNFEIRDTDFLQQSKHKISIDLISRPMALLANLSAGFLTCSVDDAEAFSNGDEVRTLLIPNQTGLNIHSLKKF
jgi:hypothetical protein